MAPEGSAGVQRQLRLFQLEGSSNPPLLTEAEEMGGGRWWVAFVCQLWHLLGCWKNCTAEVRACLCALTSYFLCTGKLLLLGAAC